MQKTVYNGDKPYIFVSYAHKDSDIVVPAIQAMQSAGCRVWFDLGIEVGTEWSNNIAQHLRDCSLFVAFISPNSVKSENCLDEISYAKSNQKTTLLIFLEENVQMPEGTDMQTARFQRMFYNRLNSLEEFADSVREAPLFAPCRDGADAVAVTPVLAPKKKAASSKKALYIGIAAVIAVLALACILVLPGLFGATDEPVPDATEPPVPSTTQPQLSENLMDYCFRLDEKIYQLPFAITDMLTDGWEIGYSHINLDTMVKGLGDSEIRMVKGDAYVEVKLYNKSGHVKTVKDCMIGTVTVYSDSGIPFEIAKGITVESDNAAIVAAFGEPNFTENYNGTERLIYAKDEYTSVGVRFVNDTEDGQITDRRIIVCNEYREGNPAETSTEVPRYLSDYVAPVELGDDPVSGNIQFQDKVYHIPCPVQEFLDDGWTIQSKPGYVAGCRTGDLTIEKGGTRISVTVTNQTMTQTLPENCVVTSFMVYDAVDMPIVLPGGIFHGMPLEDLEAMELAGFERVEYTYSMNFDYSEFEPREMALYLQCDKEAGVLNSIWMKSETWEASVE